jgi:predicted nuclease of predicted toxin-antitoxin system
MRWLVDECVDLDLVAHLRGHAHDATYIAETASSASDAEIARLAQGEGRLLLTEEKDFGELIFRRTRLMPVPGCILVRIEPARRALKPVRLQAAIDRFRLPARCHGLGALEVFLQRMTVNIPEYLESNEN